jgi:hypothetical protein
MARPCSEFLTWDELYNRSPENPHESRLRSHRLCASCGFSKRDHEGVPS